MFPIPETLNPADRNKLDSYLPLRKKGNEFEWDVITGLVLGHALKKQIKQYDPGQFRDDCRDLFTNCMHDPEFVALLDRMFFASDTFYNISPLFLLFKAQRKRLSAANLRMGELFFGLLGDSFTLNEVKDQLNFVEREMLGVLQKKLDSTSDDEADEQPYLPYLANAFQEDMGFLAAHPKYLLQELTHTLRLYAFAYCSQLALNIREWGKGEPENKPLYFILDTEKASAERAKVNRLGYKLFADAREHLFPLLSALEVLQHPEGRKRPLWQVFKDAYAYPDRDSVLGTLNDYLQAFAENRKLPTPILAKTLEEAFTQLQDLAIEQFKKDEHRGGVNQNYTRELEKQICNDFVQSRGRAGRVLVLSQDQLLLLTNLAVGRRDKLRLNDLMNEFQRRGFYLESQSQQVLVSFYERMGNVERMSDSGDAVYVRKTI